MWYDEILLDVHQIVDTDSTQLWKLESTLFQKYGDGVALFAL